MNIKRYFGIIISVAIFAQFICMANGGFLYSANNKTHGHNTHEDRPVSHECQFNKYSASTSPELTSQKITRSSAIKNKYVSTVINKFENANSYTDNTRTFNTGQFPIQQYSSSERYASTVLII